MWDKDSTQFVYKTGTLSVCLNRTVYVKSNKYWKSRWRWVNRQMWMWVRWEKRGRELVKRGWHSFKECSSPNPDTHCLQERWWLNVAYVFFLCVLSCISSVNCIQCKLYPTNSNDDWSIMLHSCFNHLSILWSPSPLQKLRVQMRDKSILIIFVN